MRRAPFVVLGLGLIPAAVTAQKPGRTPDPVVAGIESRRVQYTDIAHRIWGFAEVGYLRPRHH